MRALTSFHLGFSKKTDRKPFQIYALPKPFHRNLLCKVVRNCASAHKSCCEENHMTLLQLFMRHAPSRS